MAAISAVALFANVVSVYVGPIEYRGSLTYAYPEGENPITHIMFLFDEEIADNLLIVNTPTGWSYSQGGQAVTLSGGSLAPGGSLSVGVSCKKYLEPGGRPFTATGTTTAGEVAVALGILEITEMILLKIIWILEENQLPVLGFTGLILLGEILTSVRKTKPSATTVSGTSTTTTSVATPDEKPPDTVIDTDTPEQIDESDLTCQLQYEWMHQVMDLNVWPTGIIRTLSDDPLPMRAHAYDRHALIHTCTCPVTEAVSRKAYVFFADVSYEWEIIKSDAEEASGGFIKQTDGGEDQKEQGPMVIYQPPDIKDTEKEKQVIIKVTAHHADPTKPPSHDPMEAYVYMKIKREIEEEGPSTESEEEFTDPGKVKDEYVYTIEIRKEEPIGNPLPPDAEAQCIPETSWEKGNEIMASIVSAPGDVAFGDYIKLQAAGSDDDILMLNCMPSDRDCTKASFEYLTLNDNLVYNWTAEKGTFVRGNEGSEVIWQAPDSEGPVRITLTVRDEGKQFVDEKKDDNRVINVHKLGIDLVKTPKPWLPVATQGELIVPAKTYMCIDGKWRHPGRKKHIRLKLKKVSREPGVAMNYPKDGNTNPDLFFNEDKMKELYLFAWDKTAKKDCPTNILVEGDNPAHDHHYLTSIRKERESSSDAIIRCEDYGAVGWLEAQANHCVPIPPREDAAAEHPDCRQGPNDVKLPRDDNNNDIADKAPQDDNGAPHTKDADATPRGNNVAGDGLTNYEEYRGFITGGVKEVVLPIMGVAQVIPLSNKKNHIRTNIKHKDVFIYDEDNMGTGLLNVTGLNIHILLDEDLFNGTGSRIVNFNRSKRKGKGDQHGLWLRNHTIAGAYGMSCGGDNGPPKNKTHICISYAACTAAREPANRLVNSIAHELCHGLNIVHHGETDNHEHTGDPADSNRWNIQGGLTSGVINCIMRYDQYAWGWCKPVAGGRHSVKHYYNTVERGGRRLKEWKHNPGTDLCNSKNGTGANNRGAADRNDATEGNCKGQLQVKDWR